MPRIEITECERKTLLSVMSTCMQQIPNVACSIEDIPGNRIMYVDALKYQEWPTDLEIEDGRINTQFHFLVSHLMRLIDDST